MKQGLRVVLALPTVGALQVAADAENPNGWGEAFASHVKNVSHKVKESGKAMAPYAHQFAEGVSRFWAEVSATEPVSPIPLEMLGLEEDYTGTLGEEMNRYRSGTLIKLEVLQNDSNLHAERDSWAMPFTGGDAQCAPLFQEQCSKPYKGSLVVVVGDEVDDLKRLQDDAHYFAMKMTSNFRNRTFIVHGNTTHQVRALSPLGQASEGVLADALDDEDVNVKKFLPDVWFRKGRVQISSRLSVAPQNQLDASGNIMSWPRVMASKFLGKVQSMISNGLFASDWTPVATLNGTYVKLLPTATIFRTSSPVTASESLDALWKTISAAFGQQTDLQKILDTFAENLEKSGEKMMTRENALELIKELREQTLDWINL